MKKKTKQTKSVSMMHAKIPVTQNSNTLYDSPQPPSGFCNEMRKSQPFWENSLPNTIKLIYKGSVYIHHVNVYTCYRRIPQN